MGRLLLQFDAFPMCHTVDRTFAVCIKTPTFFKARDLITSPALTVLKAANKFKNKTTANNKLWQIDFTYSTFMAVF